MDRLTSTVAVAISSRVSAIAVNATTGHMHSVRTHERGSPEALVQKVKWHLATYNGAAVTVVAPCRTGAETKRAIGQIRSLCIRRSCRFRGLRPSRISVFQGEKYASRRALATAVSEAHPELAATFSGSRELRNSIPSDRQRRWFAACRAVAAAEHPWPSRLTRSDPPLLVRNEPPRSMDVCRLGPTLAS